MGMGGECGSEEGKFEGQLGGFDGGFRMQLGNDGYVVERSCILEPRRRYVPPCEEWTSAAPSRRDGCVLTTANASLLSYLLLH